MFVLVPKTNFDFMGKRHLMMSLSGLLILAGFIVMIFRGSANLSIDFTGGLSVILRAIPASGSSNIGEEKVRTILEENGVLGAEVKASRSIDGEDLLIRLKGDKRAFVPEALIRAALDSLYPGKWKLVADNQLEPNGLEVLQNISYVAVITEVPKTELESLLTKVNIQDPQVLAHKTETGEDTWILAGKGRDTVSRLRHSLSESYPDYKFELRSIELVGPRIGSDLRNSAILAILASWALIILYLWWRFEFIFGIAAVVALIHNILVTFALMVIFGYEISMTVVGAFLTIIGYSVNDTIVIFDRIREDLKRYINKPITETLNLAINETLSRTVVTGGSVIVIVFLLWTMGGEVLEGFAFAMLVGIIAGTYSSIYIASPLLVDYSNKTGKSLSEKLRKKGR